MTWMEEKSSLVPSVVMAENLKKNTQVWIKHTPLKSEWYLENKKKSTQIVEQRNSFKMVY